MKKENNFWKTPRGKAVIKLGLWGVFFLLIFVVIGFSDGNVANSNINNYGNNTNSEGEGTVRFALYEDMISNILKNNYEFSYDIKIAEEKYLFSGKYDGTNIMGVKETKEEVIKYYVSEGKSYKIKLDNLEALDNTYLEVNEEIIDLNKFFDSLKDTSYRVEKTGDTREIIYNSTGFSIVIKTDINEIIEINYVKDDDMYNMKFSSVGKIAEIKYDLPANEEANIG